ncbi:HlyD family secretion protein [Thalassotalea fusca]
MSGRVISLISLLFIFNCSASTPVVLTGQIKASDNQTFYAPKSDTWQVQVQWMKPEGEIAEKGELVVVFDSGMIQNTIEQEKVSLHAAKEELHRTKSSAKQAMLESEFAQKRTALLLEKAKIDANIGQEHISQYDYEQNQLNYEKAVVANAKAKEQLAQTKIKNQVDIKKQEITVLKLEESLRYNEARLAKMSLSAERSGPVLYANHPWNGEKVFVGMTAQPSWKIAEIPSMNGLYIESWVHEVDYKHMIKGKQAAIKLDAYPAHTFSASIDEISTQPEERKDWGNDVYYRVRFQFERQPDISLVPGMSVQIALAGAAS